MKALAESLRAIRAAGIENIWARAKVLARATRAGIEALGLRAGGRPAGRRHDRRLLSRWPGRQAFLDRLQTRFGIKLAGGQGPLKGRIFRIAHMGMVDELDILSCLAAIELVLAEMGKDVKLGASVAAASRVLAEAEKIEIAFRAMIELGLADVDAGRTISMDEMSRRIQSWGKREETNDRS